MTASRPRISKLDILYATAGALVVAFNLGMAVYTNETGHDDLATADAAIPLTALSPTAGASPSAARDLGPDGALSVAEPDPGQFDRAGMESWWRRYRSRQPTER